MIYSLSLGCYWHGHNCHLNRGKKVNETRGKPMAELLEKTQKNSAYIRKQGYNLVECWECEWRAKKKKQQRVIALHSNTTISTLG
jgi:G:T-mismatch repair DNA endonuclease (very short patch repair protein)